MINLILVNILLLITFGSAFSQVTIMENPVVGTAGFQRVVGMSLTAENEILFSGMKNNQPVSALMTLQGDLLWTKYQIPKNVYGFTENSYLTSSGLLTCGTYTESQFGAGTTFVVLSNENDGSVWEKYLPDTLLFASSFKNDILTLCLGSGEEIFLIQYDKTGNRLGKRIIGNGQRASFIINSDGRIFGLIHLWNSNEGRANPVLFCLKDFNSDVEITPFFFDKTPQDTDIDYFGIFINGSGTEIFSISTWRVLPPGGSGHILSETVKIHSINWNEKVSFSEFFSSDTLNSNIGGASFDDQGNLYLPVHYKNYSILFKLGRDGVPIGRVTLKNILSITNGIGNVFVLSGFEHLDLFFSKISSENYPTLIDSPNISFSKSLDVFPNYPNPFNPLTKIRFYIQSPEEITLRVYSVTGQLILHPIRGNYTPGMNEIGLDLSNYPSGHYFFFLKSKTNVATGKITLIK